MDHGPADQLANRPSHRVSPTRSAGVRDRAGNGWPRFPSDNRQGQAPGRRQSSTTAATVPPAQRPGDTPDLTTNAVPRTATQSQSLSRPPPWQEIQQRVAWGRDEAGGGVGICPRATSADAHPRRMPATPAARILPYPQVPRCAALCTPQVDGLSLHLHRTPGTPLGSSVALQTPIPLYPVGQQGCFWAPRMVVFEPHNAKDCCLGRFSGGAPNTHTTVPHRPKNVFLGT